ncbi:MULTISPECIES: hypothetical protein [unclassified Polaromonas]|jgi:hypothetical protein|nr:MULTISPECIES: hypothetical protein [unclassified Polaromonas]HQR98608.1 hypothetical protein [Polaromonas sp.]HQS41178.1 hypothetical protein [Polaromonas sp.]HQS86866.1 hypothetical protein [Polaromonas sp.]HQT06590.1 hypothetical protein [Polaromonas sp.]
MTQFYALAVRAGRKTTGLLRHLRAPSLQHLPHPSLVQEHE